MPSVLKKIVTKKQFRTWLNNKSPKTKVGRPNMSESCPIANYIKSQFKGQTGKKIDYVDVDSCDLYVQVANEESEHHINMPQWAAKFINKVDEVGNVYVTAQHALKILDKVSP